MEPHILSVLPFILLLLSIAILPLVNPKWWHKNFHLVSASFALITLAYYLYLRKNERVLHTIEEYVMFISLIGSLFVISGGILIQLKGFATPMKNVLLLGIGAILANFIGTTGASMLLIRPYIKSNKIRISAFHIVFFIFIVSNAGGALTPIGDPPLFLGYLKGIPFFWITQKVFMQWAVTIVILLVIFYFYDQRSFKRQPDSLEEKEIVTGEKVKMKGIQNFFLLLVVICSVFITEPKFLREIIMLAASIASYKFTKKEIHVQNHFSFFPIKEVAWLFIGIFITMMPALELLAKNSQTLGINSPTQLYFYTGILSALLDNAPTYLTFLSAAMGNVNLDVNNMMHVLEFIAKNEREVVAISISSVFFGAMTYLGNGPNFMVKSVANHQNVHTPTFIGYILKYSLPILLPIFVLIWFIFIM